MILRCRNSSAPAFAVERVRCNDAVRQYGETPLPRRVGERCVHRIRNTAEAATLTRKLKGQAGTTCSDLALSFASPALCAASTQKVTASRKDVA